MNASELMREDWVLVKRLMKGDIIAKVESIGSSFVMIEEENDQYNPHNFDNVYPVLLTEEMLKANGFSVVVKQDCKIAWINNESYSIKLYKPFNDDNDTISITIGMDDEGCCDDCLVHSIPTYVHEFQNTLRLCKLYDLADGFKIQQQ